MHNTKIIKFFLVISYFSTNSRNIEAAAPHTPQEIRTAYHVVGIATRIARMLIATQQLHATRASLPELAALVESVKMLNRTVRNLNYNYVAAHSAPMAIQASRPDASRASRFAQWIRGFIANQINTGTALGISIIQATIVQIGVTIATPLILNKLLPTKQDPISTQDNTLYACDKLGQKVAQSEVLLQNNEARLTAMKEQRDKAPKDSDLYRSLDEQIKQDLVLLALERDAYNALRKQLAVTTLAAYSSPQEAGQIASNAKKLQKSFA